MKIIIVLLFLGVVGSLVSAMIYMMQDRNATAGRMAWALTWRIGLSVLLFAILLLGHWLGWIEATGMQTIPGA